MTSASRPEPDDAPRELIVDAKPAPGDSSDGTGTAMAPFLLGAVGVAMLAKYVSPTLGLVGLCAVVLFVVVRKPREGRFVLRVDAGVLEIARERGRVAPERLALADLLDVTLEKQTRAAGARGGSPIERSRLVLERRAGRRVFVPEETITPLEAQEWLGKVRVFLRKHGWVPEDER